MASLDHLEIIRSGPDAVAQWRTRQTPGERLGLDLAGADLERAQLRGVDLESADMSGAAASGADFSRGLLRRVNMTKANLADADLSDASCEGADFSGARLRRARLRRTNLKGANLRGANLTDAFLPNADLSGARLEGADLSGAYLPLANLEGARLDGANLTRARLSNTRLAGAILRDANLTSAQLIQADLTGATVSGCRIYGIAAWGLTLDEATQNSLVVTPPDEPVITVDDLEVAQFIYLLLNNKTLRRVIDTVTSKTVLIIGRFTPERKAVLDALREKIRDLGYLPILFDFDAARSRTRMETVSTLAHLSRFVVADITDAKSVLQELQGIVPVSPMLPVQPILLSAQKESGMFDFFHSFPWFLPTVYYDSPAALLPTLKESVIDRADGMARHLMLRLDEVRRNP